MIDHLLETTKYLGLFISLGAFMIGLKLNKKYPYAFMNPLLIGTILVMGLILVLDVEVAVFQKKCASVVRSPDTGHDLPGCSGLSAVQDFAREQLGCLDQLFGGDDQRSGHDHRLGSDSYDERNHDTVHLGALDHDGHRVGYDRTDRRCRRDHSGRGHLRGHFRNGGFGADFQNLQNRRTDRERVDFGCGFPRHGDS